MSEGGDWIWTTDPNNPPYSAGSWVVNPTIANSLTPPNGTSEKLEAINFHPQLYQMMEMLSIQELEIVEKTMDGKQL